MDAPFPAHLNRHTPQAGLPDSQVVMQQYTRYSPGMGVSIRRAPSVDSVRSRSAALSSSPHFRKEDIIRRHSSPKPPLIRTSMSPPLVDPFRSRRSRTSVEAAGPRNFPSRVLTDDTIDDAYASFIISCNPNVPPSIDTSELRKIFRCPPRSDGKSFSIFTLWELIQKLDSKEIKTWIQLALELGVEPPSVEKKQSTQKLQQYAVRLKVCRHLFSPSVQALRK